MIYNLSNPLDVQNAKTRLELLVKLILGYFASQTGNTLEWVKQQYYKKLCNPDIFIGEREDRFLGRIKYVRSSADLRTDEMNLSIERFRNWSAAEAGIYLPEPTNEAEINALAVEVEKYKTYLF